MKTRSTDSPSKDDTKVATSPTKVKKEEEKPASSSKAGTKRSAKKDESSDEETVKEEHKTKTSPRKKPKTEGVSEVGEEPPSVFGEVKDAERRHGTLEHGSIYFIYRPRVELEEVHSSSEIAHFHMLLMPSTPAKSYRLLTIGRNYLPARSESKGRRADICWAKVLDLSDDMSTLKERLGPRTYETKTRGTRHIAPARVAGAGKYIIHSTEAKDTPKASKDMSKVYKTVLAYALEAPHKLGEVQKDLHIEQEGSFQVQVKDPKSKSTNPQIRDQPASKQPSYPKSLFALFTTKFIPANPVSLLNYSGGELLLLPSHASVEEQVGPAAEGDLLKDAGKVGNEGKMEEEGGDHAEAQKALQELRIEGMIEGKALEGHWE